MNIFGGFAGHGGLAEGGLGIALAAKSSGILPALQLAGAVQHGVYVKLEHFLRARRSLPSHQLGYDMCVNRQTYT